MVIAPTRGLGLGQAGRYASAIARQFHLTLVLAMLVGVLTGVVVAGFERSVAPAVEQLSAGPLMAALLVPPIGLVVVNVLSRWWRDADTATTDAYVRAYHRRAGRISRARLWRGVVGSATTLASGNALGFEGPSMLIGSGIGSEVEARAGSRLRNDDAKLLMVAGAAAGVAAVFKAPLTGVVFALEVPYRSDLARRALLPSLVAAGSAYVVYVAFVGTEPLLATGGSAPFDLRDLGGGLALGVVCGVLARFGSQAMRRAKQNRVPQWWRVGAACAGLFALAPIVDAILGAPLHLGPSYSAIEWAAEPGHSVTLLCVLFAARAASTWLAVLGGGMGGLFIPLVTQGAIVGSIFDHAVDASNPRLFPTIGIAAFLGAGYRTPLAGVAFVAEATGEPGFLVPALLAAAAAQLVMGGQSFSTYQRNERLPDVRVLSSMPITEVMSPTAETVRADETLDVAVEHLMRHGRRWAPVVEGDRFFGLISLRDVAAIPPEHRPELTAGAVARPREDAISTSATVIEAANVLRDRELDAAAVVDGDCVVGVVTGRELANIEAMLDRIANESV